MKLAFLFLVGAIFVYSSQATQAPKVCNDFTNKTLCLNFTEDGLPCDWCLSAAVKPGCFSQEQAKKLPPSIFNCSHSQATQAPKVCNDLTNETLCLNFTEGGLPCDWCLSAAVKPGCFSQEQAKKLPPSIFNCSHNPDADTHSDTDSDVADDSSVSVPDYYSTPECDACFLLVQQVNRFLRGFSAGRLDRLALQRWLERNACEKLHVLALNTCASLVEQHGKQLVELFAAGNFNEVTVCERALAICN
eukprot:TRINITY_DN165_c0_g2_i5.p1 TRINITY_DN165_c0_g2~~TRINITY_DN165_c0_g2_i5.p1  ORF type:complete len:247 (-),score=40.52 TRINITY_DN165_c0_g2_i5:374-1114(-)